MNIFNKDIKISETLYNNCTDLVKRFGSNELPFMNKLAMFLFNSIVYFIGSQHIVFSSFFGVMTAFCSYKFNMEYMSKIDFIVELVKGLLQQVNMNISPLVIKIFLGILLVALILFILFYMIIALKVIVFVLVTIAIQMLYENHFKVLTDGKNSNVMYYVAVIITWVILFLIINKILKIVFSLFFAMQASFIFALYIGLLKKNFIDISEIIMLLSCKKMVLTTSNVIYMALVLCSLCIQLFGDFPTLYSKVSSKYPHKKINHHEQEVSSTYSQNNSN